MPTRPNLTQLAKAHIGELPPAQMPALESILADVERIADACAGRAGAAAMALSSVAQSGVKRTMHHYWAVVDSIRDTRNSRMKLAQITPQLDSTFGRAWRSLFSLDLHPLAARGVLASALLRNAAAVRAFAKLPAPAAKSAAPSPTAAKAKPPRAHAQPAPIVPAATTAPAITASGVLAALERGLAVATTSDAAGRAALAELVGLRRSLSAEAVAAGPAGFRSWLAYFDGRTALADSDRVPFASARALQAIEAMRRSAIGA